MQVKIEELVNGLKITETIGSSIVVRYLSSYGFPFIRSTNEEGETYQVVDSVGEIYNLPAVPTDFLLININGQSYTPSTGDELIEDSFHLKPFRKDDLEDKVISIGKVTATSSVAKLSLNISGVNSVFINGNLREKYLPDEFNFTPVTTGIKVLIIYAKDDIQIFHLAEGIEALEAVEPAYSGLLVSRIIVSSNGSEVEVFGNPGDVWMKTENGAIWSPRLTEAEQGVASALTTLSGVQDNLVDIEQYKLDKPLAPNNVPTRVILGDGSTKLLSEITTDISGKLDKPTVDGTWVVTKSGATVSYTDASTFGQNISNTNLVWSADRTQNLGGYKLSFTNGRFSVHALEMEVTTANSVPNKIWNDGANLKFTNSAGINYDVGSNISNADLSNISVRIFSQGNTFTWNTAGFSYAVKNLPDKSTDSSYNRQIVTNNDGVQGTIPLPETEYFKSISMKTTNLTLVELNDFNTDRVDAPNLNRIYFKNGQKWTYLITEDVV